MAWSSGLADLHADDDASDDEESSDLLNLDLKDLAETDIDTDIAHPHGPRTPLEKRRAQNEIFRAFAMKRVAQLTEEEVTEALQNADDENLSITDILARQEASSHITNPRDYQTELFLKAREENIIAVLDTGSGKTHIATLLLRHVIDQEVERRATAKPPKLSFFLVDSVNLVFQQANVLRCGLDYNVVGVCGAMGCDLWSKSTWEKHFANNMVVVCTAEVLVQCLMHSFTSVNRINLLIFDEAHHAKKNHAYARIMNDFYLSEEDQSQRPRIFGMTASPVDAKVDVRFAARQLENLLHCKIVTTSDLNLIRNNISRPLETTVTYERLKAPFETRLHLSLKARFGDLDVLQPLFTSSKQISSEIGRWAADYYWSFALSEAEARKMELREERKFHLRNQDGVVSKLDQQLAEIRRAAEFLQDYDFGKPTATITDLSTKVLELHKWLQRYFSRISDSRCIVFVNRRHTARLLHLIFSHLGGLHLRSGMLVGVSSLKGNLNISLREQILSVASFRRGELNCMFSTSVAEEGLDIPQCNIVVRFDLYKTMISYIQSRGRARHRNSRYLHMIEQDNAAHAQRVYEARGAERLMRDFCQTLPADRFLDTDVDSAAPVSRDLKQRTFTDSTTGAKLTYGSSLGVLAHFVSSLPQNSHDVVLQSTYIMGRESGKYVCEVVLPEGSPIISATGRPSMRKSVAKRSAAFEACITLRKGKYLDENLLPIFTKQLPAMRNAHLALDAKKKDLYPMRLKPNIWKHGRGTIPQFLYLTILDVTAGLDRPHHPMGLITRVAMPSLPQFPIYLNDGSATHVKSVSLPQAFFVSETQLEDLTEVTLRVYKDIFAKKFEHNVSKMSYWLTPLVQYGTVSEPLTVDDPATLIDWAVVKDISLVEDDRWSPDMPNENLADRYFVDNWDGGRRFFSIGVAPNLRPLDPVPSSAPRHKYMADILDYSVSLWNKSRALRKWDLSQPVVKVEKIPFRRNLLAPVEVDEFENAVHCYVCPEPIRISKLPSKFVAMCYVFPAIIHRSESYLIALDACNLLGLHIGPALALEALTKDSDNSEENDEERINFRSGMGANYERLEFMGDCFLKMATSISIFVQRPDDNEFEFHVRRMCLLCNQNLFDSAKKMKLYEYVRSMAFSRRTWYPEGLKLLEGKGAKKTGAHIIKHSLGDKTVADVCEAFIGAAFIEHNEVGVFVPTHWDQAVKAVKVMVSNDDHTMGTWADYFVAYNKPRYQLAEATASQLDLARKVEQMHPYHFKYPRILRSAFIHPSQPFMFEKIPHYQRLEFLGDSLLDMVFVMHLFYRYPGKDPQWLTEHKMPMVSNKFLGALCVKLNFQGHIRQNNSILLNQITEYVTEVEEAEREAKGAVDYWTTVSEPPKCLADVVEAFVAALFVDSEFNFSEVQLFFDLHVKRYFEDMTIYDTFANNHPTTRLTKLLNIHFGCREWRLATQLCESAIPGARPTVLAMLLIHWNIVADGSAVSGRYARIKASNDALDKLGGLPQYEFRKRFGCDCEEHVKELPEEAEQRTSDAVGSAI